jgi:hypothetical protein
MSLRRTLVRALLVGIIATAGAVLVLAASGATAARTEKPGPVASSGHRPIFPAQLAFHDQMRKLWEDHITWTRNVIISFEAGLPDLNAALARLLQNQADIGNAIKPFYGNAAGNRLTSLLRRHILIAADLVAAAKAGEQARLAAAQSRWQANADQIGAFLSHANPRAWKVGAMKAMMREHLRLTTNEAVARLQANWPADVRAYDAIHRQALHMADMLTAGIVAQFPRRFR